MSTRPKRTPRGSGVTPASSAAAAQSTAQDGARAFDKTDVLLVCLLTFFATMSAALLVAGAVMYRLSRRWQRERERNAERMGALRLWRRLHQRAMMTLRGRRPIDGSAEDAHASLRGGSDDCDLWNAFEVDACALEALLQASGDGASATERTTLLRASAPSGDVHVSPLRQGGNRSYGAVDSTRNTPLGPAHERDASRPNRSSTQSPNNMALVGTALPGVPPCVSLGVSKADADTADAQDDGDALVPFQPRDEKDKTVLNTTHDSRYQIVKRIGDGAFSSVYLVQRKRDGRRYAMKYLICADDRERLAAIRECETINSVQGHPNVVRLVDMFMNFDFQARHAKGSAGGEGDVLGRPRSSLAASRVASPRLAAAAVAGPARGLMTPMISPAIPHAMVAGGDAAAPRSPWPPSLPLQGHQQQQPREESEQSPVSPTPYWTRVPLENGAVERVARAQLAPAPAPALSAFATSPTAEADKCEDATNIIKALAAASATKHAKGEDRSAVPTDQHVSPGLDFLRRVDATPAAVETESAASASIRPRPADDGAGSDTQLLLGWQPAEKQAAESDEVSLILSGSDTVRLMREARRRRREQKAQPDHSHKPHSTSFLQHASHADSAAASTLGKLSNAASHGPSSPMSPFGTANVPATVGRRQPSYAPRSDAGDRRVSEEGGARPVMPSSPFPSSSGHNLRHGSSSSSSKDEVLGPAAVTRTLGCADARRESDPREPATPPSRRSEDRGGADTRSSGASEEEPLQPIVRVVPCAPPGDLMGSSRAQSSSNAASDRAHAAGTRMPTASYAPRRVATPSAAPPPPPMQQQQTRSISDAFPTNFNAFLDEAKDGEGRRSLSLHQLSVVVPPGGFYGRLPPTAPATSPSPPNAASQPPAATPTSLPRLCDAELGGAAPSPTTPTALSTSAPSTSILVTHTGRNYNMNFTQAQNLQAHEQEQERGRRDSTQLQTVAAASSLAPGSPKGSGGGIESVAAGLSLPNMSAPNPSPSASGFPHTPQVGWYAPAARPVYNGNFPYQQQQQQAAADAIVKSNALADLAALEEKSRMTGSVAGANGVRYHSPVLFGANEAGAGATAFLPDAMGHTTHGLFGQRHSGSSGGGERTSNALHYTNFPLFSAATAAEGETLLTRALPPPPSTLVLHRDAKTGAFVNPYSQRSSAGNPSAAAAALTVHYHDFDAESLVFNRPFIPNRDAQNNPVAGTVDRDPTLTPIAQQQHQQLQQQVADAGSVGHPGGQYSVTSYAPARVVSSLAPTSPPPPPNHTESNNGDIEMRFHNFSNLPGPSTTQTPQVESQENGDDAEGHAALHPPRLTVAEAIRAARAGLVGERMHFFDGKPHITIPTPPSPPAATARACADAKLAHSTFPGVKPPQTAIPPPSLVAPAMGTTYAPAYRNANFLPNATGGSGAHTSPCGAGRGEASAGTPAASAGPADASVSAAVEQPGEPLISQHLHSTRLSDSSSHFPTHTGYLCLVMEYHPMGDLCRYVLRNKDALEKRKRFQEQQQRLQTSQGNVLTGASSMDSSSASKRSVVAQQQQQHGRHAGLSAPQAVGTGLDSRRHSLGPPVRSAAAAVALSSNALSDTPSRSRQETAATTPQLSQAVQKPADPTAQNPITEAQLLSVAFQLASVLDHLHSQSPPVVHRDLKPENILIKGDASELLSAFCQQHSVTPSASAGNSASASAPSPRGADVGPRPHEGNSAASLGSAHLAQQQKAAERSPRESGFASPASSSRHSYRPHAHPSHACDNAGSEVDPVAQVRIWRNVIPIVVTDFGLAIVQEEHRRQGRGGGTRPYIAPESWKGKTSTASDVWGYGCVLYALATGRLTAKDVRIMSSEAAKKERSFASMVLNDILASHYSLALASFVVSLLVVDPEKRPTAAMAARCFRVVEDEDGEDMVVFDETSPFFSNVLDL